jgi:hypothetical protein
MSTTNIVPTDFVSFNQTKKLYSQKRPNNFLSHIFGRATDPASEVKMLKFFLSVLEVKIHAISYAKSVDVETTAKVANVSKELLTLLSSNIDEQYDDMWNEAYKLERELALAEPVETLDQEIQRKLDEVSEDNLPAAPRLRAAYELAKKDAFDQSSPKLTPEGVLIFRNLLQDILEEYHKFRQRKFGIRPIQRNATNRIITSVLLSFLLILVPFFWLYAEISYTGHPPVLKNWAWLPLYLALTSGLFGAFFSRMQALQSNWNRLSFGQVRDAMDWRAIIFRGAIGMSGALIMYFFLRSGLVQGGVFPKFEEFGFWHYYVSDTSSSIANSQITAEEAKEMSEVYRVELAHPSPSLALLIVWSFIAGFSERFVPGILTATETSLSTAVAPHSK